MTSSTSLLQVEVDHPHHHSLAPRTHTCSHIPHAAHGPRFPSSRLTVLSAPPPTPDSPPRFSSPPSLPSPATLPLAMASAPLLLPGQPLPASFTAAPQPKAGPGCYEYNGTILSSIVGRPVRDGAVCPPSSAALLTSDRQRRRERRDHRRARHRCHRALTKSTSILTPRSSARSRACPRSRRTSLSRS